MTKKLIARNASVAMQQKSGRTVKKLADLPTDQLHQETVKARETLFQMCVGAERYTVDVLLPYCEEIIKRYKKQGVAAKNRPNGEPTVESYFKSIKLPYSTVRSWIHRKKLQTETFQSNQSKSWNKSGETPHLTPLEYRLLGTVNAGHDLVTAFKRNGDVDTAIKEFKKYAPTPERIEEYIARPAAVAVTEVEQLALRLCKLIDENDGTHADDILARAQELRTKLELDSTSAGLGDKPETNESKLKRIHLELEQIVLSDGCEIGSEEYLESLADLSMRLAVQPAYD